MDRINKILFATDFSSLSRQALNYSIELAGKTDAKIVGTFASKYPSPLYPPIESMEGKVKEVRKHSRLELDKFFADVSGEKGVEIQTRLCLGSPEQALARLAGEEKADLIVVAKHSRSTVERFFMGSSTEKIVREAPCPVLVVPDRGARTVTWNPVLCATDFSSASIEAFHMGVELASRYQATVSLIHVIELEHPGGQAAPEVTEYLLSISKQAGQKLQEIVSAVETPSQVDVLVAQGKTSDLIIEKADELGSDLVILGRCGHSLATHRAMGSTTNAILRSAGCPVLVVSGVG